MNNIFITSDTHFCHQKEEVWKNRGYNSPEEMNESIVNNWNSVVAENDIVYLLGDVILNDIDTGIEYLKMLNGKIYIAIGNHDSDGKIILYQMCKNVADIQIGYKLKVGKKWFYMTHFPAIVTNYGEDIFTRTVCCLCGHSHTTDKFKHKDFSCYHVELEAHNNFPVNLEEIRADIRKETTELNNNNN